MRKVTKTSLLRIVLFAAVLLLIVILPFRIPCTIKTIGQVHPVREWSVVLASDGQLSTYLWNNKSGLAEKVTVTQLQRGDAVNFQLHPAVLNAPAVSAGDTIALLDSPDLAQAMAVKKGQLASAVAALQVALSGEKAPLVEEARQQVEQALLEAEEQKKIADRLAHLHARNLVSIQEYELALAKQRVYASNIGMARARLASVETGVKPEEVHWIRAQIANLEEENRVLEKKAAGYVLLAPISGIRMQHYASDTLVTIAEGDSFIITMPVKATERALISLAGTVRIRSSDRMASAYGRVVSINPMLQLLNGEQVFWVVAKIEHSSGLVPGLFARCEISCPPLSKLQFLRRFLQ